MKIIFFKKTLDAVTRIPPGVTVATTQNTKHNLITAGSKQDPCHTKMLPWKFAENASSINIQLVGLKGTPFSFGTVKRSYALCWQGLNLHRNPNGFPQWNGSVHVS